MLLLVLATLPELSKKRKFSYDAKREKLIIFIKVCYELMQYKFPSSKFLKLFL